MLAYRGARQWARRHMPEVLLGIYTDDEELPHGPEHAKGVTATVREWLKNNQIEP